MYCECEYGDGRLPLLFIVNPAAHSGEGYALWKQAEAVLQERSIPYEVYFSEKRGDVRQLAKRLTNVSEGAERFLIVLGGDGTLNEAIQGMQHFEQVRLGYIPTGSSNDLARDLKIGHDIRPLMEKLLEGGTEHRMDLGCVTWNADGKAQKRYFLVSCGMISEIDNGIGAILQKLKDKGLYDNTMIVFTSDHGDYMSYHHMMLKGRHLYDPLIKIPLIVKYPGQQAAGQTDSFLSENIDVAPTVLELCGQPIPPTMQGRSLLGNDHRQFVFSELQFGSQTNPKIGYMLRSDSYKLLVYGSMQDCAFYDLKKDPFELHDVSKEPNYQETLHRYQTALSDFVLFHALGKVHLDTKAPQQRDQEVLNKQAEELKAFIRSQW